MSLKAAHPNQSLRRRMSLFSFLKRKPKDTRNYWDERRQVPLREPTDRIEIPHNYGKINAISYRVLVDGKPHDNTHVFYDDKTLTFVFKDKIRPDHEVILEYKNHPNGIEDLRRK